jgi:hypothetical protein
MPFTTLPFHPNGHQFTREPQDTVEVLVIEEPQKAGMPDAPDFIVHRARMSHACWKCGAYDFTERLAEDGVHFDGEPCPVPDTGITTVITLNVPSGKIIVNDDLRPVYDAFDPAEEKFATYNSILGQAQVVEAFAAQGCAFGPVGNTSPGLYRTGQDTYVIANPGYDEETDTETFPEGWTLLADVCTGLWAYSIADHADWVSKGGDITKKPMATVVDIPAGVYEFVHHTGEAGFDRESSDVVIFADIKKND